MFKYIADIISEISVKQRLAALGIVLISIVIISVAPKLISGLTQDNEELRLKVDNQRNMIIRLTSNVNELNDQIIENQINCTDRFVKRENEILEMLIRIQRQAKRSHNKTISVTTNEIAMVRSSINDNDTNTLKGMVMPEIKTTVLVSDNSFIIDMLDEMIENVEKTMRED